MLPDAEADLVVAATSFHWVEPEIGVPKALSVLRPGGSVAIWWNLFYDPRGPDEFSRALDPIFEEFGDVESPAFVDTRQEEYWIPRLAARRASKRWPPSGSRGRSSRPQRTSSRSSAPSPTCGCGRPPSATQVLARIGAVADDEFGGRVRRTYQAVLYTGRKPAAERQPAWLTLSTALTMPS